MNECLEKRISRIISRIFFVSVFFLDDVVAEEEVSLDFLLLEKSKEIREKMYFSMLFWEL